MKANPEFQNNTAVDITQYDKRKYPGLKNVQRLTIK